ncbi:MULTISPECIES: class C sortase [unclassified Actinomyces]|uniref:class C sortase n=1 Tax=unclassified Actinomyces TaxID=2609248 RepID=UPI0013A6D2CF|nr:MULTISPECIES: class C sortase [unclassified Actinomyces]MBW3067973.1 class C sortase [Actinomyces sp. 594]NDR53175.1 class C sortase [Actinomyces sp. 565]
MGVLPFILALAGALVLAYPVLATQHNNARQQEIANQYQAQMDNVSSDVLAAELASADAYNRELASAPILDPWLEQQRPDTPQYRAYLAELDLDEVMAQIVIPKIHVDLPIYHGTDADTLAHGVGHLFGTALPVGGTSTHSVLTGHTGLGSATLFDDLTELEEGDVFYINTAGRTLKYEVNDVRVVLPTETESLNKVPGEDLVTLITCTPYGVNTHRLLVTGTRVPMDPVQAAAEQAEATPAPIRGWMMWLMAAVAVILTVLAVAAGRRVLRRARCARCS